MSSASEVISSRDWADLKTFFGDAFDGVTVSIDGRARSLGAVAVTEGNHIHVDPVVAGADRATRRRLIAHELAHVLQQRAGRVPGGSGGLDIVPELEAEAELAAALFVAPRGARHARAALARDLVGAGSRGAAARPACRMPACQPVVQIGGIAQSFDTLWGLVQNSPILTLKGVTQSERGKIKTKLRHWVDAPKHRSYFSPKQKGHEKNFGSIDELARALIGRIRSTESKQIEAQLAARVDQSSAIRTRMNEFISFLYNMHNIITASKGFYWSNDNNTSYRNSLLQGGYGSFEEWTATFNEGGAEAGRYAYFYSKKISALKTSKQRSLTDAMDYFVNNSPISSYRIAALLCDYAMVFRDLIPESVINYDIAHEEARSTHWNVNENHAWVMAARTNGIRLGAGPSATTMNVLRVACYVLALDNLRNGQGFVLDDQDKITLRHICLSLFAFWNRHANQKRAEIHTYHEVMVVLNGYGVYMERDGNRLGEFEYPQLNEIPG